MSNLMLFPNLTKPLPASSITTLARRTEFYQNGVCQQNPFARNVAAFTTEAAFRNCTTRLFPASPT